MPWFGSPENPARKVVVKDGFSTPLRLPIFRKVHTARSVDVLSCGVTGDTSRPTFDFCGVFASP